MMLEDTATANRWWCPLLNS